MIQIDAVTHKIVMCANNMILRKCVSRCSDMLLTCLFVIGVSVLCKYSVVC